MELNKLRASELRIGNLITDAYYESFKKVIVVESICDKGVNIIPSDDGKPYGLAMPILDVEYEFTSEHNSLHGIELTEEWLKRAGFDDPGKKVDGLKGKGFLTLMVGKHLMFICGNGIWELSHNINGEAIPGPCPQMKYLHQLQNLFFALTGAELTIKEQ